MSIATSSLLPEKPRRRQEESALQRAVHQYLLLALPPDAVHFAIPNGLMRSKKAAARAQGEGVRAGVPDLCVVYRSKAYFVELKAPRGVESTAQRAMRNKLIYCGADVMLARSVEQLEAQLRECGIRLRGSVAA